MAALLKAFKTLSPILRVPTGAPRIDWSHPLTAGLVGCYLPGVTGGINLAGGGGDMAFGSAVQGDWPGEEGPSQQFSRGNSYLMGTASPAMLTTPAGQRTLFWRGSNASQSMAGSSNCFYFGISYDNAGTSPYNGYAIGRDGTTAKWIGYWNGGGVSLSGAQGTILANNLTTSLSMGFGNVYFGSGANTVDQYVNGVFVQSDARGGAPNWGTSPQIAFGTLPGYLTRFSNANSYIGCVWNRELMPSEHLWMALNPYCFLLPAEREMPALYVASAGGFKPAWAIPSNPQVIGAY